MSIRKKIEENDSTNTFVQKLEKTLFDLLDDDDPVNIYMLTDICKQLRIDIQQYFPDIYKAGSYNLTALTQGDFEMTLNVTEALYNTCIRFQKYDVALVINSEVSRSLLNSTLNLYWADGKFKTD